MLLRSYHLEHLNLKQKEMMPFANNSSGRLWTCIMRQFHMLQILLSFMPTELQPTSKEHGKCAACIDCGLLVCEQSLHLLAWSHTCDASNISIWGGPENHAWAARERRRERGGGVRNLFFLHPSQLASLARNGEQWFVFLFSHDFYRSGIKIGGEKLLRRGDCPGILYS